MEGIVSKRVDARILPVIAACGSKVKCLNREEFVVVGWTDPEGARPWLGALLLAYYDPDGRLVYAGRAGTGIGHAELERLWRRRKIASGGASLRTPQLPIRRRYWRGARGPGAQLGRRLCPNQSS